MKLEVGKYYKDEKGEKVGPVRENEAGWWDYKGSCDYFNTNGTSFSGDDPDLIEEWVDEPSLTIQEGKYYKTRAGKKVGPLIKRDNDNMPFFADGYWYYYNGSIFPNEESSNDIVSEWPNEQQQSYMYYNPDEPTIITTNGTWSPKGSNPKTNYVYEISFEVDKNGHPDWSTAKVKGK